jgi:tungstate transport system substrate-binding protein
VIRLVHPLLLSLCLLLAAPGFAADTLRLASTTSTRDSGLFDSILPPFREATGIKVDVVAVGTGRALDLGRRGDADAVVVHAPAAELAFVEEGAGVDRRPVMYNHFLLVGPAEDPASIRGEADPIAALRKIAAAGATFASRGDDSGTHKRERALWQSADVEPEGSWYRETGSGMGATLNTAAELPAYTLVDSGTWLAFSNRRGLEGLVQGAKALHNPYAIIRVNPARHPHVATDAAIAFSAWLVSEAGQEAIAAHRVGGEQLFFPLPPEPSPAR